MKNIFKYLILFLPIILCAEIPKKNKRMLYDLLGNLLKLIFTDKIIKIETFLEDLECLNSIINISGKEFTRSFDNTGTSLNDIGNENECIENELTYFQIRFYLENFTNLSNEEDIPVLNFLEQHFFYLGFCFKQNCTNFFKNIVDKDPNYRNYLYKKVKITQSYLFYLNKDENGYIDVNGENKSEKRFFFSISTFFYIYVTIKFVIGIIRLIIYPDGYEAEYNRKYIDSNLLSDNKINEISENNKDENKNKENIIQGKNNYISNTLITNKNDDSIQYNPYFDNEGDFPIKFKILKLLDLFDNINNYSTQYNRFFNSNRINSLITVKVIIMYFLIYYHILDTNNRLPGKNFLVKDFYTSLLFFMVKLSIHATNSWIVIDAAISSFKLMNYIKFELLTNKNNEITAFSLFKFWILSLPKVLFFFFLYFFFHIYSKNFSDLTRAHSMYNFYYEYIQPSYYCYEHPYTIFSPLFFYHDFFENKNKNNLTRYEVPSPFFNNCYGFVNVYENEFYLFLFMILLIYILSKLKDKKWEEIIFITNIIYFIFIPSFNYILLKYTIKYEYPEKFKLSHVLGENYSIKYPHLAICFYYFGFIIGVCYFYYYDESDNKEMKIENEKIEKINKVLPFAFCRKIVNKFKSLTYKVIILIFYLMIFIILLICSNFSFIQWYYSNKNEEGKHILDYDFTNLILIVFNYEKFIFAASFFVLNFIILVYPKNTFISDVLSNKLFVIFDRISFCFYCISNSIITFSFITFVYQIKISYLNIFFLSVGFFLLLFLFSLLLTVSFEYPLRVFIKWLTRTNLKNNSFVSLGYNINFKI